MLILLIHIMVVALTLFNNNMIVLVCGSRDWTNIDLIRKELETCLGITKVIHGACQGADILAGKVAKELNLIVEEYPANWSKYRLSAGPKRNQQMLDEGKPDYVIAFHDDINKSKGTKDMINRTIKAGIKYKIIRNI